jgi:AraC-like DNA-binding protein
MRAATLANYIEVTKQLGLRPADHLRAVGLSPAMIQQPEHLISSDAAVRLLENTAAYSNCITLGLRMSEPRPMSQFGILWLLLSQQPTLRDIMRMALKYLPFINESLAITVEEDNDIALLREEVLTTVPMPQRQAVELSMAANVKIFRSILGPDWSPQRVHFRHPAPESLELHQRVFRCRCEFSSDFNAMAFAARDLDTVNPTADPMMANYAMSFVESLPGQSHLAVVTDAKRLIYLLMPLGRATVKQVANSLSCSVRKLQQDLDRADTSFAKLLDESRQERVRLYLENPKFELHQVASLLGYAHQSSFTRWFINHFGVAPSRHGQSLTL